MLVVLANRYDAEARALVDHWAVHNARLLTCQDLSVAGWRFSPAAPTASTAVIGGERIGAERIVGVLIRSPAIAPWELTHVVPSDQDYIAAEMTAFLRSWLCALPCSLLNRPTAGCLGGPGWRAERWVAAAAGCGIAVRPLRRRVALGERSAPAASAPGGSDGGTVSTVTVVGDRCVGAVGSPLASHALRLARAAGVGLLAVSFERYAGGEQEAAFLAADPWPKIAAGGQLADAVLEHLLGGARKRCETGP